LKVSFPVWFVSIQGRINVLFCGIVLQKLSKVINRDLETDLIQGLEQATINCL
jgi:hypothetical protein